MVTTDPVGLRSIADKADFGRFTPKACAIVLCKEGKKYRDDGSAATRNLFVAARVDGLGACWVAGDKKLYADDIRRENGAPDCCKLVSIIPIGYPAEHPQKTSGHQRGHPLGTVLVLLCMWLRRTLRYNQSN